MATKKTSTKFDTAHNIETEADLTNKTATVKNLVTGETYQGSGGDSGLPDISAGDAGKVLAVSDELAAEWVAPKSGAYKATITPDAETQYLYHLDITVDQAKEIIENGSIIYMIDDDHIFAQSQDDISRVYYLTQLITTSEHCSSIWISLNGTSLDTVNSISQAGNELISFYLD